MNKQNYPSCYQEFYHQSFSSHRMKMFKSMLFYAVLCLFATESFGAKLSQVTQPLNHVEGPHWDYDNNVLYYVDILSKFVVKYDPSTGNRTHVYIEGGYVSPVLTVIGSPDEFVVGRGRDLVKFKWDGQSSAPSELKVLATVDENYPTNIFNDGKADSKGRIWAGTIVKDGPSNTAALYLFPKEQDYEPIKKESATTSNGLAWDDTDSIMYYIDSPTGWVDIFDFNSTTTEISNRRHLFSPSNNGLEGTPDGMTLDADGNLWVALWGGSRVAYVNATTGSVIQSFKLPATQVSSCVWGGKDLDTLYITTSRQDLPDGQQPQAGSVFALTETGLKGQQSNKARL